MRDDTKNGCVADYLVSPKALYCLFLFYFNDLTDNMSSTVRLFADDTLLYLAVESKSDTNPLYKDLHELENWENKWFMEFNTDKCQVLGLSRKMEPLNHEYTPHGKVLEVVDSVKYLGVIITSDLRWNQQISKMETKGNQTLGFLRRNPRINSPDLKSINSLQEDSPAHCGIRLNCLGPTYQTL